MLTCPDAAVMVVLSSPLWCCAPQARVLAANRKPLYCTLRTRKRCAVLDADGKLRRVHHILNECVVDRSGWLTPSQAFIKYQQLTSTGLQSNIHWTQCVRCV